MKSLKHLILLLPALVVFSCTVQKRMHTGGYHVEWRKNYSSAKKAQKEEAKIAEFPQENSQTSSETTITPAANEEITVISGNTESPAGPVSFRNTPESGPVISPFETQSFQPEIPVNENDDTVYVEVSDPSKYATPEPRQMRNYWIFRIIVSALLFLFLLYLVVALIAATSLSSTFLGGLVIGILLITLIIFTIITTVVELIFHYNRPDRKRARRRRKLLESLGDRIGPDDVVVPVEVGSTVIKRPTVVDPTVPKTD